MLQSLKARSLLTLFAGNSGANLVYMFCLLGLGAALDKENFGLFRVGYAYITIGAAVALLGLNSSLTKHFLNLSLAQKKAIAFIATPALLISSIIVGVIAYLAMPTSDKNIVGVGGVFYFLAFPISIGGAAFCHMALAIMQASSNFDLYARLQFLWRALLFGFAMVGGLIGGGALGLVVMASAYVLVLPMMTKGLELKFLGLDILPDYSAFRRVVRSAVWPLASVCVSTFYASAEFLYIRPSDITSGIAGSYSLASLIYLGGAAFFFPFQTYAVSKIVSREIDLKGVVRLQGYCFLLVACVAALGVLAAYALGYFDPVKYDHHFFDFSLLVAAKLTLWGAYAVTGSVIYFVGKEFESFLLSASALGVLFATPYITGLEGTLRNMVLLQIVIGVVLLFGATYLFIDGFRGYMRGSEQENSLSS